MYNDLKETNRLDLKLSPLKKDMNIIQALDDEPNDVGGLTASDLKSAFDEGGNAIKSYINGTLIPELNEKLEDYVDDTITLISSADMQRGIYDKKRREKDIFDCMDETNDRVEARHSYVSDRLPHVGDIKITRREIDDPCWQLLDGSVFDVGELPELEEKASLALCPIFSFSEKDTAPSTRICYAPEISTFVRVSITRPSSTYICTFYYSVDGEDWEKSVNYNYVQIHQIKWFPEQGFFLAVGSTPNSGSSDVNMVIYQSTKGTDWNIVYKGTRTGSSQDILTSVNYSKSLERFVATGYRGSANGTGADCNFVHSVNGKSWTPVFHKYYDMNKAALTEAKFQDSVWADELEIFVAVGNDGTGTYLQNCGLAHISEDGISWRTYACYNTAPSGFTSVAWSPRLKLLAATGVSTNANYPYSRMFVSRDGINWDCASGLLPVKDLSRVSWCEDLGVFVVGALKVTGSTPSYYALVSRDGYNWHFQDLGHTGLILDAAEMPWGETLFTAPTTKLLSSSIITADHLGNILPSGDNASLSYIKIKED